jgi:hypothetical protein
MRRRLWFIFALLALALVFMLPTQVKDLASLTKDDPRLSRALAAEPGDDRRLQLWLGSQTPLERLQLGVALLHQNFLTMPITERRKLGWNLAAVSEWNLGDRDWRDEMLNVAVYVLVASEAPPLPQDVARAQALWPTFLEAVGRQKKPEDAWRRMRDTEASFQYVLGEIRQAERIWRELIPLETEEKIQILYQRRLDAALAGDALLPLEEVPPPEPNEESKTAPIELPVETAYAG